MSLTLNTFAGDFRAYKAQIAAQYNGVNLAVKVLEVGKDDRTEAFRAKSVVAKLPLLETPDGALFESNAIARYIAKIRRDTELAGKTFFESAQVDAWQDFCSHEVELPVCMWVYPVLGQMSYNAEVHAKAVEDTHAALATLEKHLLLRTYVVGEAITLADISLVSALYYPFRLVLDAAARSAYPSVERWFVTCVNQPQFSAILGDVQLASTVMVPAGTAAATASAANDKAAKAAAGKAAAAAKPKEEPKPKEEKKKEEPKPKEEKKPKKKDDDDDDGDDDDIPKEPKKADPFAGLPKPTMDMDEWKRTYSNSRSVGFYPSLEWFWKNLDTNSYTLWRSAYKFNDENKVDWQTSNLVGGFLQRCDECRKYAFGCLAVLGDKAPFEVNGIWLLRGQDVKVMLEANPDAEYYEWIKLDHNDEATRKIVADYWCATETLEGKPIYDSKIFK